MRLFAWHQNRLFSATRWALAASWLASCGQLTSRSGTVDGDGSTVRNLGCIQGVVVNGLTGEAVGLSGVKANSGFGLRVLVADKALTPGYRSAEEAKATNLSGHYTLCNIPLDETYPLQLHVDGFQPVEGFIKVSSTASSQSPEAKADLAKLVPTEVVNIRLYPVGARTADLKYVVTHDGVPQKDATVILTPTGQNTQNKTDANEKATAQVDHDRFLIPQAIRPEPLTVTTDEMGVAIFPADKLVLGSEMHARVLPPAGASDRMADERDIHIGLLAQANTQNPYLIFVDLKNPVPAFDATPISSSIGSKDYKDDGSLSLVFNCEIELVPGTEDNIVAQLTDDNGAELVPNVRGNFKTDQVNVTPKGNTLVLVPVWKTKGNPKTEGGLKVTFSGISVRPTSSPGTADAHQLGSYTVPVFGAVTPPQTLTAFGLPPGTANDNLSAPALTELAQPIVIRLVDQFGNPFKQSTGVTFATGDDGTVRAPTTTYGSQSVTVSSESGTGLAKVIWRLGKTTGSQSLVVTVKDFPTLTVKATALAVASYLVVTPNGTLNGKAGSELASPVEVQVLDQNRVALNIPASVQFNVTQGGGSLRAAEGPERGTALTLRTDANGKASVYWTLGNGAFGPQQQLEAKVGTVSTTVVANATSYLKSLLNLGPQTIAAAPIGADVSLSVELRDQAGNAYPLAGKVVVFQLFDAQGTIRAAGTASGGSTTFSVQTDNYGRATALLRLVGGAPGQAFRVRVTNAEVQNDILINGTVAQSFADFGKAGDRVNAAINTDLTYAVQLKDQNGGDLRLAGVRLSFQVTSGTGIVRKAEQAPADGTTTLRVVTDADGRASVLFRPTAGSAGSNFAVTVKTVDIEGGPATTFTGSVQ